MRLEGRAGEGRQAKRRWERLKSTKKREDEEEEKVTFTYSRRG